MTTHLTRADVVTRVRNRNVLVTGGLGFIGSALVRRLCAGGANVRVLDSLLPQGGGTPRNLAGLEGVEVVVEDVRNRDAVDRVVADRDLVFHLAAPTRHGDWYTQIDVACLGTLHVLEAIRVHAPNARLVFTSSGEVYGGSSERRVSEGVVCRPNSLFGVHKLAGEQYCNVFQRHYALDVVVARISSVFGPRQQLRGGEPGTFAHVLSAVLNDDDIVMSGDALQPSDLLYVDDAVDALAMLGVHPEARTDTVNVGSGEGIPLREVAAELSSMLRRGRPQDMKAGGAGWPVDGVSPVLDVSRLHALGEVSSTPMRLALEATLTWFTGVRHAHPA